MASLSFAGALSGAGNAASGALSQAQQGFNAASLQAERDKLESERLKSHEEFLHTENEATRTGQAQEGILQRGHAEKLASAHNQVQRDIAEQQITTQESIAHGVNEAAKEHNRNWFDVYGKIADAREKIGSLRTSKEQLDPVLKARIEPRLEKLKGKLRQAEEAMKSGGDPAATNTEIDAITADIDRLLGVDTPAVQSAAIKDPFGGPTGPSGSSVLNGTRTIKDRNEVLRQGP